MNLGELIQEARKDLNISQRELAKRIDTSHTFISKLENNKIEVPNPRFLHRISEVLDLDYINLMKLVGILPDNLNSKEIIDYKDEVREEWINRNEFKKVEIDYELYDSFFDAYIEKNNGYIYLLKIFTEAVHPEILAEQIKISVLDIVVSETIINEYCILDIIYPIKQIRKFDLEKYLLIKERLEYLPIKINLVFK